MRGEKSANAPHAAFAVFGKDWHPQQTWAARLSLWAILTIIVVLAPPFWLAGRFSRSLGQRLASFGHRFYLPVIGVRVKTYGMENLAKGPCLMMGNHQSWLDIGIIGGAAKCTFISTTDVQADKFLGFMADIQHSVYVDRGSAARSRSDADLLLNRLHSGERIVMFPEATTSNGNRVLTYKSSLCAVADQFRKATGAALPIIPFTLLFSHASGLPVSRREMPYFAWYGNMTFLNSITTLGGVRPVTATLIFHPPLNAEQTLNRKKIARCGEIISRRARNAMSRGVAPEQLSSLDLVTAQI